MAQKHWPLWLCFPPRLQAPNLWGVEFQRPYCHYCWFLGSEASNIVYLDPLGVLGGTWSRCLQMAQVHPRCSMPHRTISPIQNARQVAEWARAALEASSRPKPHLAEQESRNNEPQSTNPNFKAARLLGLDGQAPWRGTVEIWHGISIVNDCSAWQERRSQPFLPIGPANTWMKLKLTHRRLPYFKGSRWCILSQKKTV